MEKECKKILVVEDERETLEYVVEILKGSGYEVISTVSGYEAIDLAKRERPDIVILDIVLPDIDGGSVAFNLSKDENTLDIPIIFLTGIIRKEEESLLKKRIKRHNILAKPINREELLSTIDDILGRQT